MATKKNTVVDPKTIAVPGALRKSMGTYAEQRGIHIYQVIERGWSALQESEKKTNSTGTSSSNGTLPKAKSADNIDTLLSVEDLLQKAATKLRMLRESANGSVDPVSASGETGVDGGEVDRVIDAAKESLGKAETPDLGTPGTAKKRNGYRANHQ